MTTRADPSGSVVAVMAAHEPGTSAPRKHGRLRAAVTTALAGTALLAAACGGGSSHAAGPAHRPAPGRAQELDVFAQCMRDHGEPDFYFANPQSSPSPSSSSAAPPLGFMGYMVYGINPSTAPFPAAMHACKHLLPGGGPPPATQQQIDRDLKFAACLRAHGYPGYPDPDVQNGHLVETPLPASIDTSSPQFQAAEEACGEGP